MHPDRFDSVHPASSGCVAGCYSADVAEAQRRVQTAELNAVTITEG